MCTVGKNGIKFGCISQVGEVVEVDGEVASILTLSRYAEDFTFQPPGGPRGPCGVKPKVSFTSEFVNLKKYLCLICLLALEVSMFVVSV